MCLDSSVINILHGIWFLRFLSALCSPVFSFSAENIPFLLTAERTRVLKLSAAFPTSVPEQLVLSGLNNAISLDFHWVWDYAA